MNIRIADIVNDSIVDGKGIRLTVFTQGCRHNCPGCHNPSTHSIDGGRDCDTSEIINAVKENPLLDGITISGGEPFLQPEACTEIALAVKELGLNVWVYTGFTYEEILADPVKSELLKASDVLVDGKFLMEQRSLELDFRGSLNQRLIDIKESLVQSRIVEYIL